ncbi:hypothetical protein ACFLXE_00240 [Chloroflexota bacterium]
MALNEADTRAKLIDPGLHARDWTEDIICYGKVRFAQALDAYQNAPNALSVMMHCQRIST